MRGLALRIATSQYSDPARPTISHIDTAELN